MLAQGKHYVYKWMTTAPLRNITANFVVVVLQDFQCVRKVALYYLYLFLSTNWGCLGHLCTGNHHHFPALQRPWQNKAKEQKLGQLKLS